MTDPSSLAAPTTFVPPGTARAPRALPLLGMRADARLDGLLFELSVEQRYQNITDRPMEAVFTFAVPLHAVLLGLELELGDRKLEAVAMPCVAATERYEKAIDAGNAAVLLESRGNGQWTVSVGNLKPNETALIRYRHAELLEANRGYLRMTVPTVIAPRYGETPQALRDDAVTAPGVDLFADYPFAIQVMLVGLSSAAGVNSPTHRLVTTLGEQGLEVALAREARMDRDFVLEVEQGLVPGAALVAQDTRSGGWVSVASVVLADDQAAMRPLALKLLIDCSGSMGGDSIDAAKRAVLRALEQMDARDHLSVQRFGSSVQSVTRGMVACQSVQRDALRRQLAEMDADLGGTEMAAALSAAIAVPVPRDVGTVKDLLVITDGEIEAIDDVVALAAASGHRLFVVAVGAAPVEALARRLADETGGACEFVAAGELAEDAVLRMFRRLRAQPRRIRAVTWPVTPLWTVAPPLSVFAGETLHLVAGFAEKPSGLARCEVIGADATPQTVTFEVSARAREGDLLARVVAMRRLPSMAAEDESRATQLAVDYQLATKHTSFVVVAERTAEQKSQGLPATVSVPHMLAAGWGGTSRVALPTMLRARLSASSLAPAASMDIGIARNIGEASDSDRDLSGPKPRYMLADTSNDEIGSDDSALSVFRSIDDSAIPFSPASDTVDWAACILRLAANSPPYHFEDLGNAGLTTVLLQRLREAMEKHGVTEADVIDALLQGVIAYLGAQADAAKALSSVWKPKHSIFASRRKRALRADMHALIASHTDDGREM